MLHTQQLRRAAAAAAWPAAGPLAGLAPACRLLLRHQPLSTSTVHCSSNTTTTTTGSLTGSPVPASAADCRTLVDVHTYGTATYAERPMFGWLQAHPPPLAPALCCSCNRSCLVHCHCL